MFNPVYWKSKKMDALAQDLAFKNKLNVFLQTHEKPLYHRSRMDV